MTCDLCGANEVSWDWKTPNTITPEQADAGEGAYFEDESWLVCTACHDLIVADNPTGLLMRAVTNLQPTMEGAFAHPELQIHLKELRRLAVAQTHSTFWANKTDYERIEK